ncbi:MAG: S8 family peptidase [Anaerolineae bacterium]
MTEQSDKERESKEQVSQEQTLKEYYVEDQVLLTGPVERIEAVLEAAIARLDELEVVLELASEVDTGPGLRLWGLAREKGVGTCLEGILPDFSDCLEGQLAMRLYRIIRRQPYTRQPRLVEDVVSGINEVAVGDPCVSADPNGLVGYPYSVAGSPYSVAGSPYSVAGSPFASPGTAVRPEDFWTQWALKRIGLIQNGMRTTGCCGQGVRVGVFDTSPFAAGGRPVPASWGHPPLLTVMHPDVFGQFPVPPPSPADGIAPPDLSSHGLSVAGLVYAVAPHSDIFLYRVLDKHARGNLFVLCQALMEFMGRVLSNPDVPNGAIINLSLGLPLPANWQSQVGTESIFALEVVLALAHCLDVTVVASAGNESTRAGPVAPAEFPASLPHVIGIMASNYDDDRSCFSNEGDVTAPGGDGYDCGNGCEPESENTDCSCPWNKVADAERWKYGVIGPVLPNSEFPHGFARWLGTSFAAPLVSGLAALVLDKGKGTLSPEQVWVSIRDNARAAAGASPPEDIIDVRVTLQNTP